MKFDSNIPFEDIVFALYAQSYTQLAGAHKMERPDYLAFDDMFNAMKESNHETAFDIVQTYMNARGHKLLISEESWEKLLEDGERCSALCHLGVGTITRKGQVHTTFKSVPTPYTKMTVLKAYTL